MTAVMPRSEVINFRVSPSKKALIKTAADALGKNATDFMVETLCEKAHEVLADRAHFQLSQERFAEFSRLLDEPVSSATLRLLAKRSPWE